MIYDRLLRQREASGKPVLVGMFGAGFMAKGVTNQIVNSVPGMTLAVICNRSLDKARLAFEQAGVTDIAVVETDAPDRLAQDTRAALVERRQLLGHLLLHPVQSFGEAVGIALVAGRLHLGTGGIVERVDAREQCIDLRKRLPFLRTHDARRDGTLEVTGLEDGRSTRAARNGR